MLGEASHGTAEYYRWRAALTIRLIEEHGFAFVAVEGDWPDCFRENRRVKDRAEAGRSAREVLNRFERWPAWMWANVEVARFVDWLRGHNRARDDDVGFYGLDVYSLWDSLDAVHDYLAAHQPDMLTEARRAFSCFEPYGEDPQRYAWATPLVPTDCEDEVVSLLVALRSRAPSLDDDFEAALDARAERGGARGSGALLPHDGARRR